MDTIARTLRVPKNLYSTISKIARENHRSINAQILLFLEEQANKHAEHPNANAQSNAKQAN